MKKIYISLAAMSLLFIACKKDGKSPEYTNFKVLRVEISQMPFQKPNGNTWDSFDGPDVYFDMELQNNTVLGGSTSTSRNNVTSSQLPLGWDFVNAYAITNIEVQQFVTAYDDDGILPDDQIGYVGFTMSDYKGTYPKTVTKSNGYLTVTLTGEWY